VWSFIPFLTCVVLPSWRANEDGDRPSLSGPERIVSSANGSFDIHYTLEGEDAVGPAVEDGSLPDAVAWTLEGLELGEDTFQARGYRDLIGDEGAAGSDAIDVYLKDIDANGYANAVTTEDGSSCYIRLDNGLGIDGVLQSVAIHELHHCVQYRYTTLADAWIYEATATYEQYRTYLDDNLELAVIVLYSRRLEDPQLPMDWTDGEFEYAGLIALQFWEQFRGTDARRVPRLWDTLSSLPSWRDALDFEADRWWGLSWDQAFLEYATWNAFACANNDGSSYDETVLPCNAFVALTPQALTWQNDTATLRVKLPDPSHSAAYWRLPDDQPLLDVSLTCEGPRIAKSEITARLVEVDAQGRRIRHVDTDPTDEVPVLRLAGPRASGGELKLITANTGNGPLNLRCLLTQEPPTRVQSSGCGCNSGAHPIAGWFLAPLLFIGRRRQRDRPPDTTSSSRKRAR
jgi:hypothetical protein